MKSLLLFLSLVFVASNHNLPAAELKTVDDFRAAAAKANAGTVFDEPIYTTATGLAAAQRTAVLTSAAEQPIPDAHSDHRREFYDQEHRYPVRPPEN